MTLWVINRSPLIWGGNLTDNTAADLALMNNTAVIAPGFTTASGALDNNILYVATWGGVADPIALDPTDLLVGKALQMRQREGAARTSGTGP